MKNNSLNNTTKLKKSSKQEKLVLLRQTFLLGLVIEKYKSEVISINRGITSTPNVVFYQSNTKCLLDFTNITNTDIADTIKEYFTQIPTGTTIYLVNGGYYDPNSKERSDLSGTFTFRSFVDGIVKVDVVSVSSLSTKINRYDKTKFEDIPYIVSNTISEPTQQKTLTIIKNKFGKNSKNSFSYLGVNTGDFIEIPTILSPSKVFEINIDSDGNEYILIENDIIGVDLTSKKTLINIYIDVIDSYQTNPSITETETGSCVIRENGIIIKCIDNNTKSQCRFRSSKLKNLSSEISINSFCSTPETDTAIQKTVTENLVQITSALVNSITNINNTAVGPINKNGSSRNSFYGRSF